MMRRLRNGRHSINRVCVDEGAACASMMRILQDAIEEFLQDLPEQALAALIEKKLTAQGVKLSPRQRKLLTRRLMEGTETFRLWDWKSWENPPHACGFSRVILYYCFYLFKAEDSPAGFGLSTNTSICTVPTASAWRRVPRTLVF